MRRWYVVRTQNRSETKAEFNLARQGFEVYLPHFMKTRRHARRVERVKAPFFPGYLFVAIDLELEPWRAIKSTLGVSQLILCGDTPAPLHQGIIEEIVAREDDNGLVSLLTPENFRKGQEIEIVDGPMADQIGLFDCLDSNKRVTLLFDLLGRKIRVKVPLIQVKSAA